jgi:CHAD domain-containing protein
MWSLQFGRRPLAGDRPGGGGQAVGVPDYEFLLAEPPEAVWAALGSRYSVVAGARSHRTRVLLDTFDGRLRTAGMALAYLSGPRGAASELVLTGPDGATRQPAVVRWPALIDAVPAGLVAERLRPVVGIRALLPMARVRSEVGEWRVLNGDDKTVVRAYVDQTRTAGVNGTALPGRLRLVPVRGYDGQAARVAHLLIGAGGAADPASELELLLSEGSAGLPRPVRFDVSLHPGQDAATALAGQLLAMWQTIEINVPGLVSDLDTEFLHDLRVAVRRIRAMLKLAGHVLPDGTVARFAPEFKWLGDLTTPVRDIDVLLLGFPGMLAELMEADPEDLSPLREHLHRERLVQRRLLLRGLRGARVAALAAAWREALTPIADAGAESRRRRRGAGIDAQTLATRSVARAWRRVAQRAGRVAPDSSSELLHDLRKRAKELRYVLELTAGVCRPLPHRALLKDLKAVQDSLGEFQDAEVHRDAIRGCATAMLAQQRAGAVTLLAMGELVAHYGRRQQQAAAAAVSRVELLVTRAKHHQVSELVVPR